MPAIITFLFFTLPWAALLLAGALAVGLIFCLFQEVLDDDAE